MTVVLLICFSLSVFAGGQTEKTEEVIKVGAPLPLTGAYAADGEHMLMGMQLAVDDLNAAGGVLGKKVELVTFDIEDLLAETVTTSAEYLLKKEKVHVIVEGYGGWGPDFLSFGQKSDVPFFHGSGSIQGAEMTADNPDTCWNMFQVFSTEGNYGIRAYEGLTQFSDEYEYPNKKIALIHGDLEWDLFYTAAVKEYAEKDGWQVVMDETVPYGTTDWGSILLKIREEKPAAIVCSILSVSDISSFTQQFMENPTPSMLDISYMVVFQETQDAVGEKLKGVMGYITSYVPPGPVGDSWKKRFKDKFGMDVPLTTPPSTYDSIMIWADAVEKVGDARNYKAIANTIKTEPYTGLLGVYKFNNPQQTVEVGPDFPIAYGQYLGNGELAFYGSDDFIFPPWIKPVWNKK